MHTGHVKSFTYIFSNRHRNVLYTGSTDDLRKRFHFRKKRVIARFTRKVGVDLFLCFEEQETDESPVARERQLKSFRRERKIQLIQTMNPKWNDLYERRGG